MSFDKSNPKTTDGDIYVSGKTTEQVIRALVEAQTNLSEPVHPWLTALVARFDRKAAARESKAA